jgi:hypothetical protein
MVCANDMRPIVKFPSGSVVVPFPRKPRRRSPPRVTVGNLVDEADAFPLDQITAKMVEHCARILPALGTPADQGPEFMRHLILAGRLFDRLIFQVYGVPKQRAHRI